MPTRITRTKSYSYKGLFGVRHTVRRTTTSGTTRTARATGGTANVVHWSGTEILALREQRRQDIAALTEEGRERHEEAMRRLSPWARQLHTMRIALIVFVVGIILSVLTGGVAGLIAAGVFAIVDWHNFTTLHGKINWPLFRYLHSAKVYWLAVGAYACFAFLPACVYLAQCIQQAGAVREIEREKLQASIAELERDLAAGRQ